MDPAELRRRNYLSAADLPYELDIPYRDGNPLVYDSGDFKAGLEAALRGRRLRRAPRRAGASCARRGIHRGIGISGYVEGTAIGPYEGATVRLDASGRAVVATGACSQGQGHETSFAQIAADALGIPLDWVTVVGGDTAAIPFGVGTFASRSAVNAGSSIHEAAGRCGTSSSRRPPRCSRRRPPTSRSRTAWSRCAARPASAIPLARVIQAAIPTFAKPGVASPDFEATVYHHQPTVTYTSAVARRAWSTWTPAPAR